MSTALRGLVVAGMGLGGAAHAERAERPLPTKINVDPALLVPPGPVVTSRLVYMHRCPPSGCIITQGTDDSRTNRSMIAGSGTRTIGPFTQSDAVWDAVMACVRATYAPFDIGITDVDPGPTVPHFEQIVGGRPGDLRDDLGGGVGGVSPFTCNEIPNAITYTFDVYGPDPDTLCWTAAQEIAHAFGLEHEVDNRDPMTYLTGPLPKRFQAVDVNCGEFEPRSCDCGGTTQNSYMYILDMFGPGVPTAPTVNIKSPASGKQVQPGFVTKVEATDDVAVDRVELWIDGAMAAEVKEPPYNLAAPDVYEQGPHTVEARAYDVQGTPASETIEVELGPPCTASKGCTGEDVCVMGQCIPGPGISGGLGNFCTAPTECLSGQCVGDTSGAKYCVEMCDLSPGSCPSGFQCLENSPGAGVCWQTEDTGCCSTSGSPIGPAFLAIGVFAFVLRRRAARAT